MQAISSGEEGTIRDILAAVTPGGGKSLLPVIAAARLIEAGIVDRICLVVPRDSLRLQAEEAFADPHWRQALDHGLSVRAAENAPDPCRGLAGYVTTYQAIAAAPDLHLTEFTRHRYLLVIDEIHHLPALGDAEPTGRIPLPGGAPDIEASWSRAILPLLELARIRLLLSGTLMRADGRGILWLPYRTGGRARTREVEMDAPGWAVIGYSRADALAERAVLPVTFGAIAGEASWMDEGLALGPHRLDESHETTRAALFTALRTGFAEQLLDQAFDATRHLRAERRRRLGLMPGEQAKGLGKLLVVAPDQAQARRYLEHIRARLPERRRLADARLAVSDERDAQEMLAAFRLLPEPAILVTVAMAYEGMDAPSVSVVASLTHIRSRPWLEQMIARATRVDPDAGPWEEQRALVYHPDDLLFRAFRRRIETEQGTVARQPKPRRQAVMPWLQDEEDEGERHGIVPLASNATGLRYETLAPGLSFVAAARRAAAGGAGHQAQGDMLETPSMLERHLRHRIGEMVAAQVVEDEEANRLPRGQGNYHRLNAVLKRVMGGKARADMTLAELEAALGWLERNRLSDHLQLIRDDPRYAFRARQLSAWERRRLAAAGKGPPVADWRPPVGRTAAPRRRSG